jgi:hypothetical protein
MGFGHSGALVGNATSGYDYYSYSDSNMVDAAHYDTLTDALNAAAGNGYTQEQHWTTDTTQDAAARAAAQAFNNTPYDLTKHNCWDMTKSALLAAGLNVDTNSCRPNKGFRANTPNANGHGAVRRE